MAGKLKALQQWCKVRCEGYRDVEITNMTSSWKSGLAFCAIIHRYRPDLIDYDSLSKENTFENSKLAFDVALECLGIPALLDPDDMVTMDVPDKLCIITYIAQYYNYFHNKPQEGGPGVKRAGVKRPSTVSLKSDNNPPEPKKSSLGPSISNKQMGGDELSSSTKRSTMEDQCHICHGKVYLLERHYSAGRLCHRKCQREADKQSTLQRSTQQSVKDSTTRSSVKPMDVDVSSERKPSSVAAGMDVAGNDLKVTPVSSGVTSSTSLLKSLHTPAAYPATGTSASAMSVFTSTSARSNIVASATTSSVVSRGNVVASGLNYNLAGTRTNSSPVSGINSNAPIATVRGNVAGPAMQSNVSITRSDVTKSTAGSGTPVPTSRSSTPAASGARLTSSAMLTTTTNHGVKPSAVISSNASLIAMASAKGTTNTNTSNDNATVYRVNIQRSSSPNNARPKSAGAQTFTEHLSTPVPAPRQAFLAETSTTSKNAPISTGSTASGIVTTGNISNKSLRPASALVSSSLTITPKTPVTNSIAGATVSGGGGFRYGVTATTAGDINKSGKAVAITTVIGGTSRDLGTSYGLKTTFATSATTAVKNVTSRNVSASSSGGGSIGVVTTATAGSGNKNPSRTSAIVSNSGTSSVPSFGLVFSTPPTAGASTTKQSSTLGISSVTKPRYSTSVGAGYTSVSPVSPVGNAQTVKKTPDVVVSVQTTRSIPVSTITTSAGMSSTGFKASSDEGRPLPLGPVKMNVDIKSPFDRNVASTDEKAMLFGLMQNLSSAVDKKQQSGGDRLVQGSGAVASEAVPAKPPRATENVSPAAVMKQNVQPDVSIKKETGDTIPDWQLEAEKRKAARNGMYVDPEKYPRSVLSPMSPASPVSPGTGGAPARPPPPSLTALNSASGVKSEDPRKKSTSDEPRLNTKVDVIAKFPESVVMPVIRPTITVGSDKIRSTVQTTPEKTAIQTKRIAPLRPANVPATQHVYYEKTSHGGKATYGSTESLESIVCKDGQKKPNALGTKSNLILRQEYGSVESLANSGTKKKIVPASKFSFGDDDDVLSTAAKLVPGLVFTLQESAQLPTFDDTTTEVRQWLDANQPRIGAAGNDVPMRQVNAEERIAAKQIEDRLDVLDESLRKLEDEGRLLEEDIRSRNDEAMDDEQDDLMIKWFQLVKQRYELVREESELIYKCRQQELEDIHSEVEFQYRCMMQKPDYLKTEDDRELEESLLKQLLETVSQRNNIIDSMEVDRKRYVEEDQTINAMLEASGLVSPVTRSSSNGKDKKKDVKKKKSKEEGDGKPKSTLSRIFSLKLKPTPFETTSSSPC